MIHLHTDLPPQLNALLEILLLLIPSAIAGYWLAKLLRHLNTRSLKHKIRNSQNELEECQSNHLKRTALITMPAPKITAPAVPPPAERTLQEGTDNLTVIEGIGPKIEQLLIKQGISTYEALANSSPILLKSILNNAGPRFQIHDPSTWPQQARYLCDGDITQFNELKQRLLLGKHH